MSTDTRSVSLSDSEATLRQVRGVLADFIRTPESEEVTATLEERAGGLADLVKMLVSTYSEIMDVIESLRKSRGLLEQASMERLRGTHVRLAEVSSATEVAATGMLDGIDRALTLVDDLEEGDSAEASASTRDDLRMELHKIMDLLQFQDITSQQLGYASGVLFDIEQKMVQLSRLFDSGLGLSEMDLEGVSDISNAFLKDTCDPEASTLNAEGRQALADEIFTAPSS